MRFLIKATMPVKVGNKLARSGRMGEAVQSILDVLKPEATYFLADKGQRMGYYIVNMEDASEIPKLAEPLFLTFNSDIEIIPIMTPEDLAKAGPDIGNAVEKFG